MIFAEVSKNLAGDAHLKIILSSRQ